MTSLDNILNEIRSSYSAIVKSLHDEKIFDEKEREQYRNKYLFR